LYVKVTFTNTLNDYRRRDTWQLKTANKLIKDREAEAALKGYSGQKNELAKTILAV